jgi:hypothetical protein
MTMNVRLIAERPPASEAELSRLLRHMGSSPPSDYVEFLRHRNGCRIEGNVFRIDERNSVGVNSFLDVHRVIAEKAELGDRLSTLTWPVADAEGGNYVCLSCDNAGCWRVVFWDHETEAETVLGDSFSEFLEALSPFGPASVELKPGQVISVWVDPNFVAEADE